MFDLKALAISTSTVLHLTHPVSGEKLYADEAKKLPVTVTVASRSSREYKTATNAMINRRIKRGNKPITAEQSKEEGIEILVACCLDSENLVYDGDPVKAAADFRALLSDDKYFWLKEQIDETVGAVDVFLS